VLPFLLRGLEVAARQTWKPREVSEDELVLVHQEERFLVLNKPAGMLSVPARDETVTDCLVARVLRRFPYATGPLAVHRLDLDTSGLLLVALDAEMYRLLQAQFLSRGVHKRYVAVLEGTVEKDEGVIELPLRVDLEQRPRQLVDFQHGKSALTRWQVISRDGARTRVAFFPMTGRTHQLRVHAAHQLGLGSPIVGDRLYGAPAARLLLHAEVLRFRHPLSGAELELQAPAPF
jgi:tRNA pseudouridine32 synthase/23S rRNA pseudouridine746 synthase